MMIQTNYTNKKSIITILLLFACPIIFCHWAGAQNTIKLPPSGFDIVQTDVPHGKIDTVTYLSKTVGTSRKAIIYTPPGYSKERKYPVLYLLYGIGGDEKEWLKGGQPQVILDNLYALNKVEPMIVVMPKHAGLLKWKRFL